MGCNRSSRRFAIALVSWTVIGQGCTLDGPVSLEQSNTLGNGTTSQSIASEVSPSRERMSESLAMLGKAVAKALGSDESLRQRVRDKLLSSGFPEGKVSFQAAISDEGLGLLTGVSGALETEGLSVMAIADSISPLEIYMPVDAHRKKWDGTRDILVVTAVDDTGPVVAFDPRGRIVPVSMHSAPELPTLVIVPAETDFDRPPSTPGPSPVGQGVPASLAASGSGSLVMTKGLRPRI